MQLYLFSTVMTHYFYRYIIFGVLGPISLFFSAELFDKRFRVLYAKTKNPIMRRLLYF